MNEYDAIIIGGGPAGIGAGLPLARSRRTVLLVDDGQPRNARADGVHNYPGREGVPPAALAAIGNAELGTYGGDHLAGRVAGVRIDPTPLNSDRVGFLVSLDDGRTVRARRVIVASGALDVLPAIPGLAEQWGRGVVHCPYCHGWEVRDRRIGVIMTSPMGAHQVQLFRQLTDTVTAFVTDPSFADAETRAGFAARGVSVVDGPVAAIESTDGEVSAVVLGDGSRIPVEAVAAASSVEARIGFLEGIGLRPEEVVTNGVRFGSVLPVDALGRTSVPGVWAAGNVTNVSAIVIAAAAAGVAAGAQVNADLVAADVSAARAAA
jgi:thioredoxin reductase (NADPH)